MVPTELSSLGRREVVVVIGKIPELLGIWPVSAAASVTSVEEAQAAKEDPKGQAQAVERAEKAHSARDFGSVAEVVNAMVTHTRQAVWEQ